MRTGAEFESMWVYLTSENVNWFGAPPSPPLFHSSCVALSRRVDRMLLRQEPHAAVEKTGFCVSGCVVDFIGAAESG